MYVAEALPKGIAEIKIAIIDSGIASSTIKDNPDLREAILYAEEKGAVVVAAVGNTEWKAHGKVYYPAAYDTASDWGALP